MGGSAINIYGASEFIYNTVQKVTLKATSVVLTLIKMSIFFKTFEQKSIKYVFPK